MIYYVSNQDYIGSSEDQFQKASVKDALLFCHQNKILGVDTENQGLHPVFDKHLVLVFGNQVDQYVIDCQSVDVRRFKNWLESPRYTKIFHNLKYDYGFMYHHGISMEGTRCTLLRHKVRYGGLQYKSSLDSLLDKFLGVQMDKTTRNSFIGHEGPLSVAQILYAAGDVQYLIPLWNKFEDMLIKDNQLEVARLEEEAAMSFSEIEYNGLEWDRDMWMDLYRENHEIYDSKLKEMDQVVFSDPMFAPVKGDGEKDMINSVVQGDLFTPTEEIRKVKINWGSPQQRLKIFQCIDPKITSTKVDNLKPFLYLHPLLKQSVSANEYYKSVTSYGEKFQEHVDKDGKVRTKINQILQTGRISCSKPNMQQIPAKEIFGNRFRNCFKAPEGWVFVSSDFSSQELCIIATGSEDPVWLGALERGEDLHSTAAEIVYGKEWEDAALEGCAFTSSRQKCSCPTHKRLRTACKSVNFGLAYGMGAPALAGELMISKKEAEDLIKRYFEAFPTIKRYLEALGGFGVSNGYAKTFPPFNRKRRYRGWRSGMDQSRKQDRVVLGAIERQSKNHPFQGTGGDQTKTALVLIRRKIKELGWPVKIVMQVHDQVDTICHKEYAERWKEEMTQCMEEAALTSIPSGLLKAETNISDRWQK